LDKNPQNFAGLIPSLKIDSTQAATIRSEPQIEANPINPAPQPVTPSNRSTDCNQTAVNAAFQRNNLGFQLNTTTTQTGFTLPSSSTEEDLKNNVVKLPDYTQAEAELAALKVLHIPQLT
jgi:hypothetical protein